MKKTFTKIVVLVSLTAALLVPASSASAFAGLEAGTWQGLIVEHDGHFDYEGSACEVDAEVCIYVLARYRIVALTDQAERALSKAEGKTVRLSGALSDLLITEDHMGTLVVAKVKPAS